MNQNEIAAQLEFFKDIGVDSVDVAAVGAVGEAQARQRAASRIDRPGAHRAPLQLDGIRADIGDCQRCKLAPARTHIVFGSGNPNAELVFVGEAPGYDEDQQGLPFVGRAGQLLTKIIESIDLKREDVYICNVLKCRPPDNRNPEPDEVAMCNPFLKRQLATIRPKIVCCLGTFAAQTVLQTAAPVSRLRGQFFDMDGMRVIATFHPAYLLRSPDKKREVWEDMKQIRAELFRIRSSAMYADVAVCLPLTRTFAYRLNEPVQIGCRGLGPFRKREGEGFVVGLRGEPPGDIEVHSIGSIIDRTPPVRPETFEFCGWFSKNTARPP